MPVPQDYIYNLYYRGFSVVCGRFEDGKKVPLAKGGYLDNIGKQLPISIALEAADKADYIAILCGEHSTNFQAIDFDLKNSYNEDVFNDYLLLLEEVSPELYIKIQGAVAMTPSGGYHLYFRCKDIYPSQNLAIFIDPQDPDNKKKDRPVIEYRGKKSLINVPEYGGYQWHTGSFDTVPAISSVELNKLFDVARLFNQREIETYQHKYNPTYKPNDDTPLNNYNAEHKILDLVLADGYTITKEYKDKIALGRPNATSKKPIDAYIYGDKFVPFSASITDFPSLQKAYTAAAYTCFTKYKGDFKEFVKTIGNSKSQKLAHQNKELNPVQKFMNNMDFERVKVFVLNDYISSKNININTQIYVDTVLEHIKDVTPELVRSVINYVEENYQDRKGELDASDGLHKWMYNYIKNKYLFKRNVLKRNSQFIFDKETNTMTLDNVSSIYNKLKFIKNNVKKQDVASILDDNHLYQDFNPFEDFLKKIRPSGKNSTVEQLFEYFTFDDNVPRDWAVSMMKKHLIRSVGCGLGKIINREVLVFAGQTENIGKTEFVRWLHPFEDMAYYTSMALGKDKESMMRLTENITYLMEEMSNTNAAQLSYIKAVISNDIVDSRQLYKEYSDLYKRRANFYGTTNHPYLPATEQNTRFVTIPILNIDWEGYTKNICLTDLWYTAYQDFLQGVDYKISDEERAIQKAINLDWIKFENTFALTREYVVPLSAPYSEKECLSVVSIMEKISMITNAAKGYDFNFYTVEAALRKLGIMRTKVSAGNYVYACRIKTVEELYSVSNQSNQYAR